MLAKIGYVQDTLFVIGGKWKLPIIIAIYYGNKRFKDLKAAIPNITSHVLSKELKHLEENRLIERKVDDFSPKTIEYCLTKYCDTIGNVLSGMAVWGKQHGKKIRNK